METPATYYVSRRLITVIRRNSATTLFVKYRDT